MLCSTRLVVEARSNALEQRQRHAARVLAPDARVAHNETELADGLERHGGALVHAEELVRVCPLAKDGIKRGHVALHVRVAAAARVLKERNHTHNLPALVDRGCRRRCRAWGKSALAAGVDE
jgi:hypothetical protein